MGSRLLWVLLLAGCYDPHPAGGTCATTVECPTPLACVAGICGGPAQTLPDADPSCTCVSDGLVCGSATVTCALGCVAGAPAHCARLIPSNGLGSELYDHVALPIALTGPTIFNTDTGEIGGSLTRAAGLGVLDGVEYQQVGGIGVFVFASLEIQAGNVGFVGTRPVAWLVAGDATIDAVIDASAAGDGHQATPGPGGGAGGRATLGAGGCAPGAPGAGDLATKADAGGGGGGGAVGGASGGQTASSPGGLAGGGCIPVDGQPLAGGSGGGGGSAGATAGAFGGGGGGAIQISVNGRLGFEANGSITVGGAGGEGGYGDPTVANNAGGGGGGGGGGLILLEAIELHTATATFFAANGGGGGGGGFSANSAVRGENAKLSATAAAGGASGGNTATIGGSGGSTTPPHAGVASASPNANTGGGGGSTGALRFNTLAGSAQPVNSSPAFQSWGTIQHQ